MCRVHLYKDCQWFVSMKKKDQLKDITVKTYVPFDGSQCMIHVTYCHTIFSHEIVNEWCTEP